MNGMEINGVSLFLGKIPNRKRECFYFTEGPVMYPVAYVSKTTAEIAKKLWGKMLGQEGEK